MIGKTLGPYRILEPLGEGGMGEVWLAEDTRLGRRVAIKVLPREFSSDPERAARFEREARVLASLHHPNIATIHGFETVDGLRFLTMELAEGEDLAQRLERGAIPVEDALSIAAQIAVGLEDAHARNVTHRDLKPANVKVDASGNVKILDFGLARAYTGDPADAADPATSPTITAAMTLAGTILGTAAYMSPEQAKGKVVDQRSDIWSFGVLVFEMLTGRRLFEGETASETMAEVMKGPIDWNTLPASTPEWTVALLRRCLDRDPRTRLQSIGEARIALERGDAGAAPVATSAPTTASTRRPWGVAAVALLALVATIGWAVSRPAPVSPLVRSTLLPPEGWYFAADSPFAVSPDGRRVAFVASRLANEGSIPSGTRSIWVRDLSDASAREIEGTNGAQYPFWSPDGRTLGFFAEGTLNKIDVRGGPVITLCDTQNGRGGTWNAGGTIVFQRNWSEGLMRIPAGGGTPQVVTTLDADRFDVAHRWPHFLPDGRRFLFFVASTTSLSKSEYSGIYLGSLDSEEIRMIVQTESRTLYGQKHLLYRDGSTLMARPVDPSSMELRGDPVPIATDITGGGLSWGGAHFGLSPDGVLVHLRGAGATNSRLVWRDLEGNELATLGDEAGYFEPSLSHDGRFLAVSIGHTSNDIWIHDLERDVRTRFTFDPADDRHPIWSPDDQRIAFASSREAVGDIYLRPVSGTGDATLLHSTGTNINLDDWSSDGRWILYSRMSLGEDVWDVMAYDTVENVSVPIAAGPFSQHFASLSPDGRWLAFSSNESGRLEIYVQPFPEGGGRWMVSTDGGRHPQWTADGRELFFMSVGETTVWTVSVSGDTSLRFGTPRELYPISPKSGTGRIFSVASDGQRLLVNERLPMDRNDQGAGLVQNWSRILER